ncbi:MAG: 50S ribosomal protein L4 [Betaproteobacteria bacterium]|jgi:large subunit ribosomal protein L4|nr:MAG: 50S ribosomal protein L4 [Betaproteobacteria bacterium]
MELKIIDDKGKETSSVGASDELFGRDYNEPLVHQIVTAYMANARKGTRAQKARGDTTRSHRKPWRQKGTGRARAGFVGSPIWRGGAKIFPSSPDENFSRKINRKMYRAGMASILSQLVREGRLAVVDGFTVDAPKTKLLDQKVKNMGMKSVLIITEEPDHNLYLSSRNLPNVDVVQPGQADPVSLLNFDSTIITKAAVTKIEEMFS